MKAHYSPQYAQQEDISFIKLIILLKLHQKICLQRSLMQKSTMTTTQNMRGKHTFTFKIQAMTNKVTYYRKLENTGNSVKS